LKISRHWITIYLVWSTLRSRFTFRLDIHIGNEQKFWSHLLIYKTIYSNKWLQQLFILKKIKYSSKCKRKLKNFVKKGFENEWKSFPQNHHCHFPLKVSTSIMRHNYLFNNLNIGCKVVALETDLLISTLRPATLWKIYCSLKIFCKKLCNFMPSKKWNKKNMKALLIKKTFFYNTKLRVYYYLV